METQPVIERARLLSGQAEIGANARSRPKAGGIIDRVAERERRDDTDAGHLFSNCGRLRKLLRGRPLISLPDLLLRGWNTVHPTMALGASASQCCKQLGSHFVQRDCNQVRRRRLIATERAMSW